MPTQLGIADRDRRGSAPWLWNCQDLSNRRFSLAKECCEHASQPFGSTRKQQILHRRVNRPSTDHRHASKIGVGHCQSIRVKTEDTQHWSFAEVLGEVNTGPQHFLSVCTFTLRKRSQSFRVRLHEWKGDFFV